MSGEGRWRRRVPKIAGGCLGFALLVWLVMYGLMLHWVARPPVLKETPGILEAVPESRDGRVWLGDCWLGEREGLPVLFLKGGPFEMGYANGALTSERMRRQEDSMVRLIDQVAPGRATQFLLKFLVTYKNRRLEEHITPDLRMEIYGISRGCPDRHPELGPPYNRILNYHGAQDVSYMLMNSPLLKRGCTAFGAWGARTAGGRLMAARNFDWEADPVFDRDRIVVICEPDKGTPFISLSWSGMAGVVSGMNRDGLSVTVNGAPSDLPDRATTPTCMIAREMLQHAANISDALAIAKKRKVFVSALFLVGSRSDGRFVVIEKTPETVAVREPEAGAETLVCANHYQTPELAGGALNEEFKRDDTSVSRHQRMSELLDAANGPLDERDCARILRDRSLPGGVFAGFGHRSSLNPSIATHSVVMDLTEGVFWAASPPHQLGRFVAFDVADPGRELPDRTIPEDAVLGDGRRAAYLKSKEELKQGWRAFHRDECDMAIEHADAAEKGNPGFYQHDWLRAEALFVKGRRRESQAAAKRALEKLPAMGFERRRLKLLAGTETDGGE